MFSDRSRGKSNGLLQWSGEFAGKYLISAVQSIRLAQDQKLKETTHKFVHDFIGYLDPDGYLGPFSGDDRLHQWDLWGQYHCMLGSIYISSRIYYILPDLKFTWNWDLSIVLSRIYGFYHRKRFCH
jgi:hypothetical protein